MTTDVHHKKHLVIVDRPITQSLTIEVESESDDPEEIGRLALDMACNLDFGCGTTTVHEYEVANVQLADESLGRSRPKG